MLAEDLRPSASSPLIEANLHASSGLLAANRISPSDDEIRRRRTRGELVISDHLLLNPSQQSIVIGKGKGIEEEVECKTPKKSSGLNLANKFDPDASTSGMDLIVNRFGNPNAIPVLGSKINADFLNSNQNQDQIHPPVVEVSGMGEKVNENLSRGINDVSKLSNPWKINNYIHLNFNEENVKLSVDGMAVKLDDTSVALNAKRLELSLVTKVFGKVLPPHVVAWELRKQWTRFGPFHFTTLGEGWYLCSFKSLDSLDGVLSGGPWFVNSHIVGMEKWSTEFSPNSMKGLSSPIWIRMPHLPLHCWDEKNVGLIASRIGTPLMIDGNMFQWGKREFARICVRVKLDIPLPLGVWVEGAAGRFFQKIEYERISDFCYGCGMLGHVKDRCKIIKGAKENVKAGAIDPAGQVESITSKKDMVVEGQDSYGPWIHVKHKRNKMKAAFRADPLVGKNNQGPLVSNGKVIAVDLRKKVSLEANKVVEDGVKGLSKDEITAGKELYQNLNDGVQVGHSGNTEINISVCEKVSNQFEPLIEQGGGGSDSEKNSVLKKN
ncbi:hypothetical protein M5K25_018093 [Dendrobium thyrsiflorum]|uniref:CCHC-type domain-containing protein n=1 Tax=Dendrobium thyrsiflorum TaxID=117978 RepID=A0ABD0UI39_DENTH